MYIQVLIFDLHPTDGHRDGTLLGDLKENWPGFFVCVECLIGKQKKPILFKVTVSRSRAVFQLNTATHTGTGTGLLNSAR